MTRRATKKSTAKDKKEAVAVPVPVRHEDRERSHGLRAEMDRLFDDLLLRRFPSFPSTRHLMDWSPFKELRGWAGAQAPHVDLSESDKGYEIVAELPGMAEGDIEVKLKDDVLTLSGEKKEEREETKKDYYLSERRFGSFRRSFRIPAEVDQKKISADFKKSVLTIALPKSSKARKPSRKIGITKV